MLGLAGHAPSVALVPIPRDRYYVAQAAFVIPLLFAQWWICAAVARALAARMGGHGTLERTAAGLAPALGLPLLVVFIVPDAIAYLAFGFAALGRVVRVTAPLALLASIAWTTWAVRKTERLRGGRAFVAAAAGVLAQALAGGVFLR